MNRTKSQIRTGISAACAVLCLSFGHGANAQSTPPSTAVSLDHGRGLAVQALNGGNPELAIDIARALWEADKSNSATYAIIALAYAQMEQHKPARKAAAQAYRFSDNKAERLQMAELAAGIALREDRPTLTQIWLRRAATNTNDDTSTRMIAQDYSKVSAINPWHFRLSGGLRPTDNVNNGSETDLHIIDGVPYVGVLSGADQALSGMVGTLDSAISYRLNRTQTSSTSIGARVNVRRVALSSAAQAKVTPAPTQLNPNPVVPGNGDFGSTFAEVSLKHGHKVAKSQKSAVANYSLSFGGSWYGHNTSYYFGRASAGRRWNASENTQLNIGGAIEMRDVPSAPLADSTILSLSGGLTRALKGGDRLRFSLNLADVDSDSTQRRYKSANLRTDYHFKDSVGPKALNAKLSAGVSLGYSDYENYGFFPLVAPGGRQETSVYADVTAVFQNIDYAGFAPSMTVRAGRKSSNVSRFDTKELSVSLGIQSKF